MKLDIDRGGDRACSVVSILNLALADECLLYSRIRNLHANLPGAGGDGALRRLLSDQFDELTGMIERLVERVRELGGNGLGTMSEFLQYTEAQEPRIKSGPPVDVMIRQLISEHAALIRTLNGDFCACSLEYDDAESAELMSALRACHERMLGVLREQQTD